MSVTTTTTLSSPAGAALAEAPPAATRAGWRHTVGDALAVTWRNLVAYVRLPELIVFSTIQPVIIVLLFRYVFGDSITLSDPSIDYVDYLMPGVFVQAATFGAMATGVGLADDMAKGLIERSPSPDHGRILRTELTAKGRRLLARCDEDLDRIETEMTSELSPEERSSFEHMLRSCVHMLHAGLTDA